MGDESSVGERKPRRERTVVALSPEAEARFTRRVTILLGLIPLPEMTQAETDWVFAQKVRLAGDGQGR
jgi:hypothetical protein